MESDSYKRPDLVALKLKDYENAEKLKHELEERQRLEKKLRKQAKDKRDKKK